MEAQKKWTKEMVLEGDSLIKNGMRAADAAAEISRHYNIRVSKNALIGARLRAGLCESVATRIQTRAFNSGFQSRKTQAARDNTARGRQRVATVAQSLQPAGPKPKLKALIQALPEDTSDIPLPTHKRTYLPEIPSRKRCRWIHGDPKNPGAFWCGHAIVLGTSWCAHHLRRAYSVMPAKKQHSAVTRVHLLKGRL